MFVFGNRDPIFARDQLVGQAKAEAAKFAQSLDKFRFTVRINQVKFHFPTAKKIASRQTSIIALLF